MTRRISTILILSLLAVAFVAMSAHAVKSPDESPRVINPLVYKSLQYAFPDASNVGSLNANAVTQPQEGVSLGNASSSAGPWPGVKVGDTWYDYQHNGRMTRMVDWGSCGDEGFMVHFLWMRLATEVQENRHYEYNVYYAGGGQAGTFLGQTTIQSPGEYAGYVALDVTNDGRAVLGGHNNQGGGYQPHTYWDFGCGFAFFGMNRRVPDSTLAAGTGQDVNDSLKSAIWPSMCYQEHPTNHDLDVLHVFTQVSEPGAGDSQALIYFRKVGFNDTGEWDYPPYVPDTVHDIAQDVVSGSGGKAALVWIANLPSPTSGTASSHDYWPFSQWDNDIWYQISNNYGASWGPKINVTQNVDGVAGYRPYTDLQALITSDNDLHIVWGARTWPADANSGGQAGLLRGRVFHWGENLAAGNIRTAANLEWDQEFCNGGAWQLNASKMNVGECDGKLYALWSQFNDPQVMMNDCHNRALAGTDVVGAANGELYVAVSDDYGLTWDAPRNLTNTHTPACDSVTGAGGECRSEPWSSMTRLGTDLTGDMSGAVVVDPSGGYTGDYFLDVQFIGDVDPGGIVQDEGTWQQADVRWFRLPCVEPVPTAIYNPSWTAIEFPEWTKHCTAYNKPLTIENSGNTNLTFSYTLTEDPGPYSGWLSVSANFQGSVTVNAGTNNTLTGTVTINGNLAICTPGTIVHLSGSLTATGNHTTSPYVHPIDFWIVDTLIGPAFDTMHTGCFALVVANTGNWGNQGAGHVNLDYFDYGDCDDLEDAEDTIPGDATVYAYDASPVICWPDGDSVICNWSIFGQGYLSDNGFFPFGHVPPVDMGDFELYQSQFVTRDTGIIIKKLWIAPYDQPTPGANFIIQVLKIHAYKEDLSYPAITIGEAIDWDIPSDSASRNRSGFYLPERLIYQQGSEFNQDDDIECMENSDRYGGIKLVEIVETYQGDTTTTTDFYGAYTEDNSSWVYPAGGFITSELDSMMGANEGYVIESDSLDADLHSVMTFRYMYPLPYCKTIIIFKCLVTSRLGYAAFITAAENCDTWYEEHLKPPATGCCMAINSPYARGNVDYDPGDNIDISDLVMLVDYMFTGGPAPECWEEANIDGSAPDGDPASIDISDLVMLVDYMFTGGPQPADCP
jgi:hypothetical protein